MTSRHLDLLGEEIRYKITKYPDIAKYSPQIKKKDLFFPNLEILQVQSFRCIRKEYHGYGVETNPLEKLHPVEGIFVSLELNNMQLLFRLQSVIQFHINHPLQCIQKIYEINRKCSEQKKFNTLLLNCQLYKFTLHELFQAIKKKQLRGFSRSFYVFARTFLLQVYLSILELLDHPQSISLHLSFSLNPRNILIDRFYRLMLGNPFIVAQPESLLAFQNDRRERFMHSHILKEFLELYQKILDPIYAQVEEDLPPQKITLQAFGNNQKLVKVKDQIKKITEIIQRNRIFEDFPNQELIEYLRTAQKVLAEGGHKLCKFNQEKLERTKEILLKRSNTL